tara:strand:- start:25178 stop:25675 length:498 start_codon:yes stop_codon:yes gene_type:complete
MTAADTDLTEGPLDIKFSSHATIDTLDSESSRKFYEEFLGFEVVRTSPISLLLRLGGSHTIACVEVKDKEPMGMLNHNGLDVPTKAHVDAAHAKAQAQQEKWGIKKITRPLDQHGTYCFFMLDADENWWEVLTNPEGGYSWIFERGDQEGRGHLDKDFERPAGTS